MSWDAGSIESNLDVDLSPFRRGLEQAKTEGRAFQREKFAPQLGVDDTEGKAKVYDFKTRLESVARTKATAQVAVENGQALRKLIDTSDRLDRLRTDITTARVDADTDDARRRLDELDIQLRRIGMITSRPRVTVDGVERANLQLDSLALKLTALRSAGGGRGAGGGGLLSRLGGHAPSGMSMLLGGALPLVPEIGGVVAGVGASLLTPTVAGGLGLGLFGAAAKSSVTTVEKDVTNLNKLTAQYNAATTNKQRAAVLVKEHQLWSSLDPAQRAAVKNVQGLDASWERFQKKLQPQSFAALSGGVSILRTILRDVLPMTKAVGNEVVGLEQRAGAALKDPFWHQFFGTFLQVEAPLAVHTLGTVLGNVVTGFAHLAEQFAPLGHDLESTVGGLSQRFETWTQGAGPARFVAWVEREGPTAARALEGLVHGVEGLFQGLSPLGHIELEALTPVLNFIGTLGKTNPGVITALGGALLTVAAGMKVLAGVNAIRGITGGGITGVGGVGGLGLRRIGAIAGGVGGAVAVGQATQGIHGAGGNIISALGGATTGALAGTAVAPGVGTAIGAVGGAIVGLASHLIHLGTTAHNAISPISGLISSLNPALELDKGKIGPNTRTFLTGYLQQNPWLTNQFASAGIHEGDITTFLKTGTLPGVSKLYSRYEASGDTSSQGKLSGDLSHLSTAYAQAATNAKNFLSVTSHQKKPLNDVKGAADGASKSVGGLSRSLRNAANGAEAAGERIGTDLGHGLIVGIEAQIPHATVAGKILVQQTVKQMRLAAEARSPSRVTARLGKDLADGLVVGFTNEMGQVRKQFITATDSTVAGIARIVAQAQTDAQNRVQAARSTLTGDLSARSSTISSVTDSLFGSTDISGAYINGRVGNISGYLRHKIRPLARLDKDEAALRHKHLDPRILAQIADAGPVAGVALAESILSGQSGSIAELNHLERRAHVLARATGGTVGHALYDNRIAGDRQDLQEAVGVLKDIRDLMHALEKDTKANPHDFATALNTVMKDGFHKRSSNVGGP